MSKTAGISRRSLWAALMVPLCFLFGWKAGAESPSKSGRTGLRLKKKPKEKPFNTDGYIPMQPYRVPIVCIDPDLGGSPYSKKSDPGYTCEKHGDVGHAVIRLKGQSSVTTFCWQCIIDGFKAVGVGYCEEG